MGTQAHSSRTLSSAAFSGHPALAIALHTFVGYQQQHIIPAERIGHDWWPAPAFFCSTSYS
jgi:hypothetical protein